MDDRRIWHALILETDSIADETQTDAISATLDDFSPIAIEDRTPLPLPPGGLWDPTYPPPPEPPPAPLDWRVFFATPSDRAAAANALTGLLPQLTITTEDVPDEDWAARSQASLRAIDAGAFTVAPPWDLPGPDHTTRTVIVIEPSRGFGTGHHASTRLCLRALSKVSMHGRHVLDLGTGSGVLAMAAALKGAQSVVAVDVDPDAIESAQASHALNPRATGIDWLIGDFRDPAWPPAVDRQWDVVLANLTGGMLRSSAARIRELLAPGAHLIVSGFDRDEQPDVECALSLTSVEVFGEDGWVGLVLQQR